MKNTLELELHLKIKEANKFLLKKQYQKAINIYTEGLQLYEDNKNYNENVSQQYLSLFYSLRGNAYSLHSNDNQLKAENDFQKSLKINPFDILTLIRRANHFFKQKRYCQAIQDIDYVLIYDPQNLSYLNLLNKILQNIQEIESQQQKDHINFLIKEIKTRFNQIQSTKPSSNQAQDQQLQDQQNLLNFSNLKKIDRKSSKLSPLNAHKLKNVIQFKQDQILLYESNQSYQQLNEKEQETKKEQHLNPTSNQIKQKIKQQDQQLKQLNEEELKQIKQGLNKLFDSKITLTKTHQKSRRSILRKPSLRGSIKNQDNLFIDFTLDNLNVSHQSSIISVNSIKNIDGKFLQHQKQNIRFRPSICQKLSQSIQQSAVLDRIYKKKDQRSFDQISISQASSKRKSILRFSRKYLIQSDSLNDFDNLSKTQPNKKMKYRGSDFFNLKSIDGSYHKKCETIEEQEKVQTPVKIYLQSSDEQDFQHDIYGYKKQKQVLTLTQQPKKMSQQITKKLNKKKSILRKESILLQGSVTSKSSFKKSVIFKCQQQ